MMPFRQRPVSVLVVGEGRHLFENTLDGRILLADRPSQMPHPDLVVFPCGQDRRFERVAVAALPEEVRTRLALGATAVVFDASTEGVPHKPDIAASLHAVIHALGAATGRCVLLTQDRQYERDYRAYCADVGFERPVAVINHDYWIWKALEPYGVEGERAYQQRLRRFRARTPLRERRFLSLNRTPRPHKILFLLSLLRDGLWESGFISFGGFAAPGVRTGKARPTADQLARSLPGFEDPVRELAPLLDALDSYGRVLFGMERHGWQRLELWNAGLAADLGEHDHSWFSVVTETEMRARPSRVTEKVLKPLVNFHPFIVLGSPGTLAMIRSYGFVTFEELFDESYDELLDPRTRFDAVYREIVRTCRMGDDELHAREQSVAEKLTFNARWGLTRFPTMYRTQHDVALVNEILAAVGLLPDPVLAPAPVQGGPTRQAIH
jgi:hypothetical protein